jgi:hypothetical protein
LQGASRFNEFLASVGDCLHRAQGGATLDTRLSLLNHSLPASRISMRLVCSVTGAA